MTPIMKMMPIMTPMATRSRIKSRHALLRSSNEYHQEQRRLWEVVPWEVDDDDDDGSGWSSSSVAVVFVASAGVDAGGGGAMLGSYYICRWRWLVRGDHSSLFDESIHGSSFIVYASSIGLARRSCVGWPGKIMVHCFVFVISRNFRIGVAGGFLAAMLSTPGYQIVDGQTKKNWIQFVCLSSSSSTSLYLAKKPRLSHT